MNGSASLLGDALPIGSISPHILRFPVQSPEPDILAGQLAGRGNMLVCDEVGGLEKLAGLRKESSVEEARCQSLGRMGGLKWYGCNKVTCRGHMRGLGTVS